MLISFLIFLEPFSEVVVEARDYCDKVRLGSRKFLYGYGIFDTLGQAFIKLCHFGSFVPGYSEPVLGKFG